MFRSSELSNSKLSILADSPSLNSTFWSWLSNAQPRVLKLFDPVMGVDVQAKAASPQTLLIGRMYTPTRYVTGDPAVQASAWFNASLPTLLSLPLIDYWEGYGSMPMHNVSLMAWYATFEVKRVALLASIGRKAVIGSFNAGMPDLTIPAIVEAFYPAIDSALAHGGILGLHEYSSPYGHTCLSKWATKDCTAGRYRMLWQQYLLPTNRAIPLLIDLTYSVLGWRSHCSYWAMHKPPLPGPDASIDCPGQFVQQLASYDSILRADRYVLGATLFCYQCLGYRDSDLAPVLHPLAQYMKAL